MKVQGEYLSQGGLRLKGSKTTKVERKYVWRCDISRGGRKMKQTNLSSFLTVQDPEMTAGGGNTSCQRGSTISHNSAGQLADE